MTQIDLHLTKEEAIVLFEMLSRFSENDKLEIEDQAEQRVLWDLCASLESTLAEPFDKDYASILERARAMLRDNSGQIILNNLVPLFPCPSCGFVVFSDPAGSYDICPICDWEDDHVQLANPILRGGANKGSLLDYQQEILIKITAEIREYNGYERDPKWRPLTEEDCQPKSDIPKSGLEYFQAAAQDTPPYYWEKAKGQGAG